MTLNKTAERSRTRPPALVVSALVTAAVVVTLAVLTSCAPERPMPTPTPTETFVSTADGTLTVGTLVPASSTAIVAGVELAVRDINTAGGVAGTPIQVFHRTPGAEDTDQLETSFAQLVERGVDVVIGPATESQRQRLAPLASAAGVLLLSPSLGAPPQTADPFQIGFAAQLSDQSALLNDALLADGAQRVTLISVSDSLAEAEADAQAQAGVETASELFAAELATFTAELAQDLDASGSRLALSTHFDVAEPDLPRLLAALAKSRAEHIVLAAPGGRATAVAEVVTALLASGVGPESLWFTSTATQSYAETLPEGALEGAHGFGLSADTDAEFAVLLSQSDPGVRTQVFAGQSYDAVILAAVAAEVGGDDGGAAIGQQMRARVDGAIRCGSFAECVDIAAQDYAVVYFGVSGGVDVTEHGAVEGAEFSRLVFTAKNAPVRVPEE